jgi:alpha-L-fucosidase
MLVETVSKGGNLLLNVGPMADGRWPTGAIAQLEGLAAWTVVHGDLIRGSTASRLADASRFRSTTQGNRAHLFVHDWRPGPLLLEGLRPVPRRARLIHGDGSTRDLPVESWSGTPAIVLPGGPEPSLLPCVTVEFGGEWGVGL